MDQFVVMYFSTGVLSLIIAVDMQVGFLEKFYLCRLFSSIFYFKPLSSLSFREKIQTSLGPNHGVFVYILFMSIRGGGLFTSTVRFLSGPCQGLQEGICVFWEKISNCVTQTLVYYNAVASDVGFE